jgi:hypothetical protein
MPVIIWGSRGLTSILDKGTFYCPQCNERRDYKLKQVRPFFTLFFIPIFPIGAAQRYVECKGCRGTFREEVLRLQAAEDPDPFLAECDRLLEAGVSLSKVKQKIIAEGMSPAEADFVLDELCNGKIKHCQCGESYHSSVSRCEQCRADL